MQFTLHNTKFICLYYFLITLLSKLSDMQEVKLETECKIDIVPHGEEDIKDKAEVRYNIL